MNPLILIPAFNEERSVGAVVTAARALRYEVCVVDDGSGDATAEIAAAAGAQILRLPVNLGVGGALRAGFRYALHHGHDTVVQVDADGQHDPALVVELLEAMRREDADLVIGTRFAGDDADYEVTRSRRFAMRVLARRASTATGTTITDATSGFRAIRRPLLDRFAAEYPIEYLGDTVEALIEAGHSGARVVECPVRMSPRTHGRPSAGAVASLWYLIRVLVAIRLATNRSARTPPALPDDQGAPA